MEWGITGDGTAVMQEAGRESDLTDERMPARKPALCAITICYT